MQIPTFDFRIHLIASESLQLAVLAFFHLRARKSSHHMPHHLLSSRAVIVLPANSNNSRKTRTNSRGGRT